MDMDYQSSETNRASVAVDEERSEQSPDALQEKGSQPTSGLKVEATFCPVDIEDPFETVQWELRTAAIKGEGGEVLFGVPGCSYIRFEKAGNVIIELIPKRN